MSDKNQVNLNDVNIDEIIQEAQKQLKIKPDEIKNELKSDTTEISNKNKAKIELGDLGEYPKVTEAEVNSLFDNLEGTIIKMHNCLFRVCFINLGKRKFTCEIINEEEK